jgi:hypothetical protein
MENEKINLGKELLLTLSNKKSIFSSKKIERTIVFVTFLILNLSYITINIKTIETLHLIEITGLWLAYGGWNTYQNYRDIKMDRSQNEE